MVHKSEIEGYSVQRLKQFVSSTGVLLLLGSLVSPAAHALSGYTWTDQSMANPTTTGQVWKSVAASADGQHLVAVTRPDYSNYPAITGGDIWTSSNGGTTWTDDSLQPANSSASGLNWTSVASSANGQELAAVSEGDGVWSSLDGGATWNDVANFTMSGGNWEAVSMSADGKYLHAMPTGGDVWSSSDHGATWRNDTWITGNGSTHQNWQSVGSSADGQTVIGGVSGGDIWITNDGGTTWTDNSVLPANTAMAGQSWEAISVSADGKHILAIASGGDIWTSSNGGASWVDDSPTNSGTSGLQWRATASSADGQNLVAAASNGGIWTSNNSGTTWTDTTAATSLDNMPWAGVAANITGGKLTAVAGDFGTSGDIYGGADATLPQVINTSTTNTTIQTPSNTTVSCSTGASEASLSRQDSTYDYPLGLINLCYTTVLPSDQIQLTFVTDLTPSQVVARDFNTATQTYTTIPGAIITQTTSGGHSALSLTYTVTDNGILDSNAASNFVTDPVGLGVLPAVIGTTAATSQLTNTGVNISLTSLVAAITISSAVLVWRRKLVN